MAEGANTNDKRRRGRQGREGVKRQFLITLDPELIMEVKRAALERDISASALVEEILAEWCKRIG